MPRCDRRHERSRTDLQRQMRGEVIGYQINTEGRGGGGHRALREVARREESTQSLDCESECSFVLLLNIHNEWLRQARELRLKRMKRARASDGLLVYWNEIRKFATW